MVVRVKLIGSFHGLSGKDGLTFRFGGSVSLRCIVLKVVDRLPELRSAFLDAESGEPKTSLLVLVNGREISVLNGLETVVDYGDEVVFVPVVHGG